MTQEEKQLLLTDLCARLPYEVNIQVYYEEMGGSGHFDETVWSVEKDEVNGRLIENIKPYLRPMSSMTEEEKIMVICARTGKEELVVSQLSEFYNSHHFDYRGLISMGLALEAPEGMYKTK